MSTETTEKTQTLHYGIREGKVVLTVADDRGPLHRIAMTIDEWREISVAVPMMEEGDVKVIDGHEQAR